MLVNDKMFAMDAAILLWSSGVYYKAFISTTTSAAILRLRKEEAE